MDNTDKKPTTDRPYPNYRIGSSNYLAEPSSANSFLRSSQQSGGRQLWNEEVEKIPLRLENPLDKMKRLDRQYEKNQKQDHSAGRAKFEFLRHTIDYQGKGYQPQEYGNSHKNRDHYQSSNMLRKYTSDESDGLEMSKKYNASNANLNTEQPKQIDFLARHQYLKNKNKTYTDIGNTSATNEEELNYNLSRITKSPRHRTRTEGQQYVQNPNLTYSTNRGSYNEYTGGNPSDEIKIARTNTYAFEKKYDVNRFSKKSAYQYYTPKSEPREDGNSPGIKKSPNAPTTVIESPTKPSSSSKPSSVLTAPWQPETFSTKCEAYSPTKKFTNSRVQESEDRKAKDINNAVIINLNSVSVSVNPKGKKSESVRQPVSLNDFQLGKCLGQGKFGNVYIAVHKETRSLFALKKVKKDQIKQHKLQNQFMMEIKMQLHFNHKNVLGLYGFFDDDTYVYLILEYMEEGTLFSRMKKDKKLTQNDTSHRMKEVLQAINYLHQKNIAHRDIKPENIVMSSGICKLCDFGWSAICDERRKTLCGTIDYVTPQVLKGEEYGTQVDLWCLGVLCYELLVGKAPFYHIKIKQTMKKIMNVINHKITQADTVDIKIPNEVSSEARDFIGQLIVNDPDKRMTAQNALNHPFITKHYEEDLIPSPTKK